MYIDVIIDNHDLAQLVATAALAEGHEGGLLGEGPRPGQHKLLVVLGLDTGDALPARSQPSYFYTDNTPCGGDRELSASFVAVMRNISQELLTSSWPARE